MRQLVMWIVLILITCFIALVWGVVPTDWTALFDPNPLEHTLIFQIRLPRILTAFLVGGILSVAGAVFQSLLRNPLADPYVLGVSSGAGLGIVVGTLLGVAHISLWMLPGLAFVGGLATIALVMWIVKRTGLFSIANFVLAGIMINALFSAIMMGLLFFTSRDVFGILYWLMGDLSKTPSNLLGIAYGVSIPLVIGLMILSYPLTILSAGEQQALSLGIPVARVRAIAFALASCLTGIAVACAGMIGFIGLLIPHGLRLMFGDDLRQLIPQSLVLGGLFLVWVDTTSKVLFAPVELPVGILMAVIGVPLFITLMMKRMRV